MKGFRNEWINMQNGVKIVPDFASFSRQTGVIFPGTSKNCNYISQFIDLQ
jgi:hypothetical protein